MKNEFSEVSCIMFQMEYNYNEYLKLKESLTQDKKVELLEAIITMAINDFF